MSLALARREAAALKTIMGRHGVKCSIELQAGRPWSGDQYYTRKSVLVNHHTAGPRTGDTPSLGICKRGRGGDVPLPGPLCNGFGGRDHVYRILTFGLANHPGLGGPLTVAGFHIPKDSARISTWGTEYEHDGMSPWPSAMIEFMGRANAALCEYWQISPARSIEHATWAPRRKNDRHPRFATSGSTGVADIRHYGGLGPAAGSRPPVAVPVTAPVGTKPKPLTVDGDWGPATWKRTQMLVRVPQTGKTNLSTRRAVQHFLKVTVDGDWGPITTRALQRRSGLTGRAVDGALGPVTYRAWQRYLNKTLS